MEKRVLEPIPDNFKHKKEEHPKWDARQSQGTLTIVICQFREPYHVDCKLKE